MDAFKVGEIKRMDRGGNRAWRTFFDKHSLNTSRGLHWDEVSIGDRYSGDVGEEWKERLSAKVEGREYVPVEKKKKKKEDSRKMASVEDEEEDDASFSSGPESRKTQNEAYFARLGAQNASRPDSVPPNQGGKYTGFGSGDVTGSAVAESKAATASMPGIDDFQKDPVAALTKGFGWFSTAVGKSAKQVNDGWIQPTAQKVLCLYYASSMTPLPCAPIYHAPLLLPLLLPLHPNLTPSRLLYRC